MRSLDGRPKFRAGNVHVSLEVRSTRVSPLVDEVPRILRPAEHVHLHEDATDSLQVGRRRFHMRTNKRSGVDQIPQVNVGIGFY